jgi:H+/Cl- antiporter ClcA
MIAIKPSPRAIKRLRRSPLTSPRRWLRRITIWGGAVLVSIIAIAFAQLADRASEGFQRMVGPRPWLALLIAPAGLVISVLLTHRVFPGAQGSGIPQVIASMHIRESAIIARVLSLRIAAGKVLLTLLGLLCGASIGREGPTVQVGASLMQALGALLRLPREEAQRALVLAGGAAGVSAAFNTPLAGVVFAIEELSHSFEARTSGTVLTAVIISGIATLSLVGNYAYFGTTAAQFDLGAAWFGVLLCGVAGGALGGCFSECLVRFAGGATGLTGRFFARRPLRFAAVCGLAIAGLGLLSGGTTYGTGYEQARGLVEGRADLPPDFFLLKLIATTISYLSGIPGGIFAPSLAIGAGLGHALTALMPDSPGGALVLLGMVGYFSGVVQAPITATVIVLEMTENQRMTIPLMATAMLAFGISRLICRRPLYGALARRFLLAVQGRR